jgi:cell division ATPase FtsA
MMNQGIKYLADKCRAEIGGIFEDEYTESLGKALGIQKPKAGALKNLSEKDWEDESKIRAALEDEIGAVRMRKYFEQQRRSRVPKAELLERTAKLVLEGIRRGQRRIELPAGSVVTGLAEILASNGCSEDFMIGIASNLKLDAKKQYGGGGGGMVGGGGKVLVFCWGGEVP